MKATIVRYTTTPESADANQELIEQVFAELNSQDPGGLRYVAFRLADGVTFVHLALDSNATLAKSTAFARFQETLPGRLAEPPSPSQGTLVGSYRLLDS